MPARPTSYNGVEYASQHEVEFAQLFEFLNWKMKYEPCGRQGGLGGWNPDYGMDIATGGTLWVEIKPFPDDRRCEYKDIADLFEHFGGVGVRTKMEQASKVDRDKDLLLFAWAIPDMTTPPFGLGWAGTWEQHEGERNDVPVCTWSPCYLWVSETTQQGPVWGLYSPNICRELVLDDAAIQLAGGYRG